ncbi:unnamed protein product, partial [Mesorhabditis spiculigera]
MELQKVLFLVLMCIYRLIMQRYFLWRSIDLVYPEQQRSVNIQANGSVFVAVSLYIEASCQLNVSRFPFDHQECFVTFLQHPYKYKFVTSTGSIGGGADPASTYRHLFLEQRHFLFWEFT